MNNCSRFGGLLVLLACTSSIYGQEVQVREDRQTYPTLDEAAPSPNPPFPQFSAGYFADYPYAIRSEAPKGGHPVAWRTITMENEFLVCKILPDLSGRLQSCTDKISGKALFYANPVIRNAGTGVGWSFPVGRDHVADAPVDVAYSVTGGIGRVVTEDVDRATGMEWREEFVLRPGSAMLEQIVSLHNASAGRRGYQWSAGASVELDDPHLRVIYPTRWMVPPGEEAIAWPLNNGVDLSEASAHPKPTVLFSHGSNEPWMAVYKPGSRTGVVHYADAGQLRGKRVWFAGTGEKYIGMEAATAESLRDAAFLEPDEIKTFSEYWIPLRNLSGVSRATPDIVLNIQRNGAAATVELNATHVIAGAKIRVLDAAKVVFEAEADLDPKTVWTKTLDAAPAAITVEVVDVIRHREGEMDALPFDRSAARREPAEPPAASSDLKTQTEAAYLARGAWKEQHDQFELARLEYRMGMEKLGNTENLALAAGRTAFILNRKTDAYRLLGPISGRPNQTEAAYYYGATLAMAALMPLGARNALNNAIRDPRFALAGRLQLAMLQAREGNLPEAVRVMERATAELRPGSAQEPLGAPQLGAIEVALLRRAGQKELADKKLAFWLSRDPANTMLRVEKMLLGGADESVLWAHLAGDPERVLGLADRYVEIGAWQDAIALLERKYPAVPANEAAHGAVLPQDDPMVAYYRGYCRLKLGQDPAADFTAGAALSTLYIFPARAQAFDVLTAVLTRNDRDANAHSLMGDVYFQAGETDAAIAEWKKALALNKNLPAVHRNLGRALLEVKRDPAGARSVLEEGRRLHPDDSEIKDALPRASAPSPTLDSKYWEPPPQVRAAAPPSAPAKNLPAPPAAAPPPAQVTGIPIPSDIASRALLGSALEPEAAIAQFTPANFPKDKEPNEARRAYVEVQLQRLLAKAHAGKCREAMGAIDTLGDEDKALPFTLYGFGAFTKAAHFQYYLGMVENLCGDEKAAKKTWGRINKTSGTFESPDDVFPYLALGSLGDGGAQEKISAAIQTVHNKAANGDRPDLTFMEGALLLAAGKRPEGEALLQKAMRSNEVMVQFLSLVALHENAVK